MVQSMERGMNTSTSRILGLRSMLGCRQVFSCCDSRKRMRNLLGMLRSWIGSCIARRSRYSIVSCTAFRYCTLYAYTHLRHHVHALTNISCLSFGPHLFLPQSSSPAPLAGHKGNPITGSM